MTQEPRTPFFRDSEGLGKEQITGRFEQSQNHIKYIWYFKIQLHHAQAKIYYMLLQKLKKKNISYNSH